MATDAPTSPENIVANYVDPEYGRKVREDNIAASIAIANLVRTTLGPNGMDKLVVHPSYEITGNAFVTNNSARILDEIGVEHPAAKMMVELSSQQSELGDGTTSAVLYGGHLMKEAERLIETGLHPATIVQGYNEALQIVSQRLPELVGDDAETNERRIQTVMTAITGKVGNENKEHLARLVIDALESIQDDDGIDTENVKLVSQVGKSISDSSLVEGIVIDERKVDVAMPDRVTDASIAVLGTSIQVDEFEQVPKVNAVEDVNVRDADIYESIVDKETEVVSSKTATVLDSGADVVFINGFIDDRAVGLLAKHGVLAVRHVNMEDLRRIARATGADFVGKIDELDADSLGQAGSVSHEDIGTERMVQISDVADAKSVSIILRSGTEHVSEELERTIEDAISVGEFALDDVRLLPGAGATEAALAAELRDAAPAISSREQLAVEAFADALEVVPETLARNAGHDRIETLLELRSAHSEGRHDIGVGIGDVSTVDAAEDGIFEPFELKKRAIQNAVDVVSTLLRVDGLIATEPLDSNEEDEVVERVEKGEDRETAIEKVLNQR